VSDRCFIAAKAPQPGLVKTRLAAGIGDEAAVALYRAFLHDLGRRFADAPFPVGWFVTPREAWSQLAPIVAGPGTTPVVVDQGPGDWTTRQRALFRGAAGRGETRTVLIASDSPQVPVATVAEAFRRLDRNDLVLGPTHDGGYYLIGMRGWRDVLAGVRMSTRDVLGSIVVRAVEAGCSVDLVEPDFDVDEAADLGRLAAAVEAADDMPATRRALAAIDDLVRA